MFGNASREKGHSDNICLIFFLICLKTGFVIFFVTDLAQDPLKVGFSILGSPCSEQSKNKQLFLDYAFKKLKQQIIISFVSQYSRLQEMQLMQKFDPFKKRNLLFETNLFVMHLPPFFLEMLFYEMIQSQFIRMQKQLAIYKEKLTCTKKDHFGESLDYVCLQPDCETPQLMCYLCKEASHSEHASDSLKILLYEILCTEGSEEECIENTVELDKKLAMVREILERNAKQYVKPVQIMRTFEAYAAITKEQIMKVFGIKSELDSEEEASDEQFQKILCQTILKYYTYLERSDKNPSPVNPYKKSISLTIQQVQKTITELEKLQKQKKMTDIDVLSLFPLQIATNSKKNFKVYFTEALKGSCMKIISPTQMEMSTSGSQRLVVLQPSLEKNSFVKRWKVKITKFVSWIGVGACHLNKIKDANFNFHYSNTGHGSYLISSNGYSWSSYKPQFNSKYEPFQFKTGDIIHLEFSVKERMLKFKKESTDQTYSLEVEFNGDPIHPAVNLTGIGDCVQIIQ